MRKGIKSDYLTALKALISPESGQLATLPPSGLPPVFLVDTMAFVNRFQYPGAKKFDEVTQIYFNDKVREKYYTTLQQYKKLLNHKRSEYYNLKISELENITYNSSSDTKTFWNCVKSMDDSIKYEVTPPISEANWLNYFQNLHFNKPLTPVNRKLLVS